MTVCGDNQRLGIVGCGQSYSGELQHSVARVSWSVWSDGRAHVTASVTTINRCWARGRGEMAAPATLGYVPNEHGVWRKPMSDKNRAALASQSKATGGHIAPSADETTVRA